MKRTLADFGDLGLAEQQVLDDLPKGKPVIIGDGERPPETPDPTRTIRAEFIRYLCLYANDEKPGQTPESGVYIQGAQITEELNLNGAELAQDLLLVNCRMDSPVTAYNAQLKTLSFEGSHLQGLKGDGLQAEGQVAFRKAEVAGEVQLLGAKLGGNLSCTGAKLTAKGYALICDRLQAEGGVFLRGAEVAGEVRLLGAKLGGNLDCAGAKLTATGEALNLDRLRTEGNVVLRGAEAAGEVLLLGAKLGGSLSCVGAEFGALQASGADVTGALFLRPDDGGTPTRIKGRLDLTEAKVGDINDTPNSWPKPGNLVLDRCIYGAFTGYGISATDRIRWLNLQDPTQFDQDFWPQPWEHCAKVLREMGHAEDAREILIDKERQQRWHRRQKLEQRAPLAAGAAAVMDWVLGLTVQYGHRPLRALTALFVVWLIGAAVFDATANADALKPNNPFVLRSAEWYACDSSYEQIGNIAPRNADGALSQLDCFHNQPEAQSYPAFRAGIYSADTLLPIVHLEMQEFWIPDGTTTPGKWARTFLWVQIAMGWALSLLAVAGFSGLVKSD